MKYAKYLLVLIIGVVLGYFLLKKSTSNTTEEATTFIAYGIQRLNKMVVAEQNYSGFYSHKKTASYAGGILPFDKFDKTLLLQVKLKAQASYDLREMKVELDSANKVIHIKKIPTLKIETFPDVDFFDVQQSVFNQYNKQELNVAKQRAVQEVSKSLDMENLRKEAHEQLLYNLEEIYLLAKIYHWKIVDDTDYAPELEKRIKI